MWGTSVIGKPTVTLCQMMHAVTTFHWNTKTSYINGAWEACRRHIFYEGEGSHRDGAAEGCRRDGEGEDCRLGDEEGYHRDGEGMGCRDVSEEASHCPGDEGGCRRGGEEESSPCDDARDLG